MSTENINIFTNSQFIHSQSECSKKNIVIAAIALLAIGILISGILAIVSTLPNNLGTLNIMKQIGLPGGIALTISGGLILVALSVVVLHRHHCVTKKPKPPSASNKHLSAPNDHSNVQALQNSFLPQKDQPVVTSSAKPLKKRSTPPPIDSQARTSEVNATRVPPLTGFSHKFSGKPNIMSTNLAPQLSEAVLLEHSPRLTEEQSQSPLCRFSPKICEKSGLTPISRTSDLPVSEKALEINVTVYAPQQSHLTSLHHNYVDPTENLQTQKQFQEHLIETLEIIQQLTVKGQYEEKNHYASVVALLSAIVQLCKYSIPPQTIGKISMLLQDPLLPLELTFPLKQLLNFQNQPKDGDHIKIAQKVHYYSRGDMGKCSIPGLTEEKQLAIRASEIIEGFDFGPHGLRIAVHQRPGPRTHALIRAHVNEFLSRKRNFTFKPKPNEAALVQESICAFCTTDLSYKIKQTLEDLESKAWSNQGSYALPDRRKAIDELMNDRALSPQQQQEAKDKIRQAYDAYYRQNKEGRCAVMLYILDALKEGRHSYYARRPKYFNQERLKAVLSGYECPDKLPPWTTPSTSERNIEEIKKQYRAWVIVIADGEERYLFEAAAQHLENMREEICLADTYELFEPLADEFYAHYRIIYNNLPTFSLSVAATIHPSIVRETHKKEVCFHEKGDVPEILTKLEKASSAAHSEIFQSFERLNNHFKPTSQVGLLIDQLDRAVVQEEYYTELDPLRAKPREKIDPLYQPQVIFDAVDQLRSFLQIQEPSVSGEIQQEIKKQYPVLDSLEQRAASMILEEVRRENSLGRRGLGIVEQVARRKKIVKPEESVEEFLQRLSSESLAGYQNLRQQLYNSEVAILWLKQADQHVEGLFQNIISNLNSGFVGLLSQLLSFSGSAPSGAYLGGQALKQGSFYGILEVEPPVITSGKIVVLAAVPHHLADLKKAAGIIAEEGGPLSHAAHIARELAIPMVTGAKGAIPHLKSLNSQPVRLTMDSSGNKIEPHPLPFPATIHMQPSTVIPKKAIQDNAGGKGKHLVQLSSLFESLPQIEGIQLTFPSFTILGLEKEVAAFYATPYAGKTLKEAIEQVIDQPDQIWDLIEKYPLHFSLEKYSEALKMDFNTPLIARSSAAVEDGASSFAGMFDSIPNLNSLQALEKGIKRVLFSAFSQKVKEYAQERNISNYSPFDMAVILQQYVADAEISGVALSKDPLHSSDTVQIQLVRGVGGGVDAQGHPDIIAVDVQSNTILHALPGERSLLLKPEQLRKIGSLIHLLEKQFQFPVDVEFAIKKDKNDQLILYLLQVRPITECQSKIV